MAPDCEEMRPLRRVQRRAFRRVQRHRLPRRGFLRKIFLLPVISAMDVFLASHIAKADRSSRLATLAAIATRPQSEPVPWTWPDDEPDPVAPLLALLTPIQPNAPSLPPAPHPREAAAA